MQSIGAFGPLLDAAGIRLRAYARGEDGASPVAAVLVRMPHRPYVDCMSPVKPFIVNRRRWLQTVFTTLAGLGGAFSVSACARDDSLPSLWRTPALLDALGAERVRGIGAAWREQHADERSLADLRALLAQRLPSANGEEHGIQRDGIQRAITQDFEAGRIVFVNGWMLAVTEARQCALFQLTSS